MAAVAVKLAFVVYLDGRVYQDVYRAIDFGMLIDNGTLTIHTGIINSKTFVGPLLWSRLYGCCGLNGLLAFNLCMFVALFAVQYALGRKRYDTGTTLVALVLLAFYVGTNRNVAAGEPDDNLAALLFAGGVLVYLETRRVLLAGLCMGVAFLFKFWVPIFCIGFVAHLALQRAWRDLAAALAGMGLPFLVLNGIDGLASLRALLFSLNVQHGYSDWNGLGFKLLSTGLLFMVLGSVWVWRRQRTDTNTLFLLVSSTYFLYALANRDAFSASYVMMLCMVFASFLLAELVVHGGYLLGRAARAGEVALVLVLYVALTTAISYLNFYRDTLPIVLLDDRAAAQQMFPWNF